MISNNREKGNSVKDDPMALSISLGFIRYYHTLCLMVLRMRLSDITMIRDVRRRVIHFRLHHPLSQVYKSF